MTDLEERIARYVYRAMAMFHFAAGGSYDDWTGDYGVKATQVARAVAQDILNDIKAEEKTDE